jgi:hypothetical protein
MPPADAVTKVFWIVDCRFWIDAQAQLNPGREIQNPKSKI